jgi:transposase
MGARGALLSALRLLAGPREPRSALYASARRAAGALGSDDHAVSTANLLSMIASAKLHDLDPEEYLRDVFRVVPHWPEDRYLELAPKYWPQRSGAVVSAARAGEARLIAEA